MLISLLSSSHAMAQGKHDLYWLGEMKTRAKILMNENAFLQEMFSH